MLPSFTLQNRLALVTGSTMGIGLAIAKAFASAGARVALHGRSAADDAAAALDTVAAIAPDTRLFLADLAEVGASRALAAEVGSSMGAPDIVVHCASIESRRPWQSLEWPEAELQLRLNVWAGIELFQSVVPSMADRGWGRLIAIGSVQQVKPHPDMLVYAASKSAQDSVVRSLAHQLARTGITANTIAPGAILTPRTAGVLADAAYARKVEESIPLGFIGSPDDCAGAALLLASEAGRYISGETLYVDGLKNF